MKRRDFLKTMVAGYAASMVPYNFSLLAKAPAMDLAAGFRNPPDAAKPYTWWHWMNGNVTRDGITRDLQAMKEAGLGGFHVFHVTDRIPHGPVGYATEEWHQMMSHVVDTSNALGLEMTFHNCAGWSSSGGPWITPEESMKTVVWSEMQVRGPLPDTFEDWLDQPPAKHDYYEDIAVLAFPTPRSERGGEEGFRLENWRAKAGYERQDRPQPDTRNIDSGETIPLERIVDLSDQMNDEGRLTWDVPAGEWTIVRFGYTTTGVTNRPAPPEGEGLECDKLSKAGAEAHWNGIVTKVLDDAGRQVGKTLYGVLIDSYEVRDQNWTQEFAGEFHKRRGYDPVTFLPCVTGRVVDSIERSERFLWDFRRTIADLFAEYYYGHFAELCHKVGLQLYVEPYGSSGNFDDFANAAYSDIPMGEFWVNRYDAWHWWSSKLSSSAAHTHGRKYVGSETFTAGGKNAAWINDPYSLKALGDYFYTHGINRFIFHENAHHPWPDFKPGMTMGPHGFQMNRGNTWWGQSSAWLTYLARCQYLLQEGQFAADLCYYFGENAPNTMVRRENLEPVPPPEYDFDAFVTDTLMQMEVRNGELALPSGMRYRVLVLPHFGRTMRPEVLEKVRDLVRNGAVVVGPKPLRAPGLTDYPQCDQRVTELADEIWGDADGRRVTKHALEKGAVYWGAPLAQVLSDAGVRPDFQYSGSEDPDLRYIHRIIDGADVYFVSNQTHRFISVDCTFRATGTPELWHPETGTIEQAAMYRQDQGATTIPMLLAPAESVFVAFQQAGSGRNPLTEVRHNNRSILEVSPDDQPALTIQQAVYGVLGQEAQTIDLTRELSAMVRGGQLDIIPSWDIAADPAPGHGKQLYVKYALGGRSGTVTAAEDERLVLPIQPGGTFLPAAEVTGGQSGALQIRAWKVGNFQLRRADGSQTQVAVESVPDPLTVAGSWTVRFPRGWGAPEQITFDRLMSWTDHHHTDIRHFSGSATYTKDVQVPAGLIGENHLLWLDLGRVKNLAEVRLNGMDLGILWKPPFRVNITDAVKPGNNQLEIQVTNLWPNRLIGDEAKPDIRPFAEAGSRGAAPTDWETWLRLADEEIQDGRYRRQTGRYTWATWRHYEAGAPLLESGLIGPVRVLTQVVRSI